MHRCRRSAKTQILLRIALIAHPLRQEASAILRIATINSVATHQKESIYKQIIQF